VERIKQEGYIQHTPLAGNLLQIFSPHIGAWSQSVDYDHTTTTTATTTTTTTLATRTVTATTSTNPSDRFEIVAQKEVQLSRGDAARVGLDPPFDGRLQSVIGCVFVQFYKEHIGRPFFEGLVGFMTSGPAIALALRKENAIKDWCDTLSLMDIC
jgi:hypothetical protein